MIAITSAEQWHELRRTRIGGSEVAALFGCSPWHSTYSLWQEKAGRIRAEPLQQTERMFWGAWLQGRVAAGAVARGLVSDVTSMHDEAANIPTVYCEHPTLAGMGASPDGECVHPDHGRCLVEVKCVDWLRYRDDWLDGPPLRVSLQGQHTLACVPGSAYAGVFYIVLVGGNQLETYYEPRSLSVAAEIERRVTEFWRSIADGTPPPPDGHDATTASLVRMHPEDDGSVIDLSGQAEEACEGYLAAIDRRKEANLCVVAHANALREMLGDATAGTCEGYALKWALTAAGQRRLSVKEI